MIFLKTPDEIETMRTSADLISRTMGELAKWVQPGVTTNKLESVARQYICDNGGRPSCLGYSGFPAALCIEVNETVVHGFPSNYTLREGDIIGIDTVVEKDGFNSDMCYTFPVGDIDDKLMKLLTTTYEALYVGIGEFKIGNRIGHISNAIQTYCERRGFSLVREMTGHGIGRSMHEEPEVPNYGRRGIGALIRNGMVLAIEPMVNMGSRNIVIERDGWTCRTKDRKPSAHYEHTVAMLNDKADILTTFKYIDEALGDRAIGRKVAEADAKTDGQA